MQNKLLLATFCSTFDYLHFFILSQYNFAEKSNKNAFKSLDVKKLFKKRNKLFFIKNEQKQNRVNIFLKHM